MPEPLISIVLPTYNGSKFIHHSIDSCLQQSFEDFELIIVNDCSTDDTKEIIEEYAKNDNRIKIINNLFNKKLPISLNTGFDAAQGKYHTWTSDDNYYSQDALEEMVKILEKDSSIDLVYSNYYLVDENDRIFGKRVFNNVYDEFTKWLGCGACFLYKKEIYAANNGYNPSAFLIEDYDFFMRAFFNFKFHYLNTPELYYYRDHPDSLTSLNSSTINDLQKIMTEKQMANLEKKLPTHQLGLIYRKFAIYHAVQKNNSAKYRTYLRKLRTISLFQTLITIFYVPGMKIYHLIKISFTGWFTFLKLLFVKR